MAGKKEKSDARTMTLFEYLTSKLVGLWASERRENRATMSASLDNDNKQMPHSDLKGPFNCLSVFDRPETFM